MAKTKISISLIKEGLQEGNVIKEGLPYVELPNGNRLYYNHSVSRTPKWVNSFFGEDIPNDHLFQTKSVSALLLYNVEIREGIHRLFAICFGYGRNLLRNDVTERRFGLITVLNLVDEKKIRSVDTNSMGVSPRNNRIQTSLLSNMMGFNIDKDKDILKAVAGKTSELDEFSGMLSGTDSLSLTTDLKYNNIDELLVNCYDNYQRSDYKEKFPWIDKMTEVKDKNIIKSLHDEVIEKLNSEEPSNIWISIPEIVNFDMEYFKFISDEHHSDIDIQTVKEEFRDQFSIEILKSVRISCYSADDQNIKSWALYRCLYADIPRDDCQYMLNDGKWYKVASDFVQETNDFYQNTLLSNIDLPDYRNNIHEDQYNREVCNNNNEFCLMDKQLIRYGGSTIEFCDIYTANRQFIHVKKYSGSAVLSHLFFQGLVSAESFLEPRFRELINQKIDSLGYEGQFLVDTETLDPRRFTVIFAIAKKDRVINGIKPDIPFFSKVSFKNVSSRLKNYGYNVNLKFIFYEQDN